MSIHPLQSLLESIATKSNVTFIVEGMPNPYITAKFQVPSGVPLEKLCDLIGDHYGYRVMRNANNRKHFRDIFVFEKTFSDVKDQPCLSYEEVAFFFKKAKEYLTRFGSPEIDDRKTFGQNIYKTITFQEKETMKRQAISINKLSDNTKKLLQQMCFYFFLDRSFGKCKDSDYYLNANLDIYKSKDNKAFIGKAEAWLAMMDSGNQYFPTVETNKAMDSTYDTEYTILQEAVNHIQLRVEDGLFLEDGLSKKPLFFINPKRAQPMSLLISLSEMFGLRMVKNKVKKEIRLTYPNSAPPKEIEDIFPTIFSVLPYPILRCAIKNEKNLDMIMGETDGNRLLIPNEVRAKMIDRTYNVETLPGRYRPEIVKRMRYCCQRLLAKNKSLKMSEADYFTRSYFAVNRLFDCLGSMGRYFTSPVPPFITAFDTGMVQIEEMDQAEGVDGPAMSIKFGVIQNGSKTQTGMTMRR
jgi:hypothetical protein